MVHEPSLQLLQLSPHLATLLGKAPSRCSLLFGVEPVCGFRSDETRKTVLGSWASRSPSMELTAPHRQSSGTLTQRAPTGPGLATNTLPVWAVEPCFGVGFHCAHISSVYGVLLYPILDDFARHAWLGPRTTAGAKLTNADWAQATPVIGRRCVLYCTIELWFLIQGSGQYRAVTLGQISCSGMGRVLSFTYATNTPCPLQPSLI